MYSILFLYRDRVLSGIKPLADPYQGQRTANLNESAFAEGEIQFLFEAAQNIRGILSALESSAAPIITPYAGFSVFVAAHINMYGTVSPRRYPGGQERAEQEKEANFAYLERLCKLWPVGQNWVNPWNFDPIIPVLTACSGELSRKRTNSTRP